MDWTLAITRNRNALLQLIATLLAMTGGGLVAVLPRHVRLTILRGLRPGESALRRLIVIAAHEMAVEIRTVARRAAGAIPKKIVRGSGERAPVFPLFDRRKHFNFKGTPRVTRGNPRVWQPGMDYPVFVKKALPSADDLLDATRLCRRIRAMQIALDDLPKQARRLARWQAKRDAAPPDACKYPPLRPGRPPGHRTRHTHPVDQILSDCHDLARYLLNPPDT